MRFARTAALVAASLAAAGTAQAQDRPRYEIDVEAQDEDLAKVMADISRQTGRNILVHPDVRERVTISLRRVSWRDAVAIIAEFTGCKVERYPGGVISLKKPRTVSLQFTDANVRTVLMLLADYAQLNMILGPDVTGNVTVDLQDVDTLHALKAIVETAGQGRYVVVGNGGERPLAVGDTASDAPAPAAPAVETVEGRLVRASGQVLQLKVGAETQTLAVPDKPSLRALLEQAPPGSRVVVTVERRGEKLTVKDVIAHRR